MSFLFELVARILRVPPAPDAPPGDEGATRVFRASSRYYYYRLAAWAARQALVLTALFSAATSLSKVGLSEVVSTIGIPVLVIELLISYAAVRLDYEKRWYLVTNRSLRIREGVMRVSEITISFANIQNVSISQGPIQRLLGISDLRVDTAGGGGMVAMAAQSDAVMHTAFFRGVDNAERIRELIQEQLRGHKDSGLGDPDDVLSAAQAAAVPNTGSHEDAVLAALRQVRAAARELSLTAGARANRAGF